MASQIPPKALEWLVACQYPKKLINTYRTETRLVQDIGIVGNALEEQLQVLRDVFHVDFPEYPLTNIFHPRWEWTRSSFPFGRAQTGPRKFWSDIRRSRLE